MPWMMPRRKTPAEHLARLCIRVRLIYPDGRRTAYLGDIGQRTAELVRHIRCSRPDVRIVSADVIYERDSGKHIVIAPIDLSRVRGARAAMVNKSPA